MRRKKDTPKTLFETFFDPKTGSLGSYLAPDEKISEEVHRDLIHEILTSSDIRDQILESDNVPSGSYDNLPDKEGIEALRQRSFKKRRGKPSVLPPSTVVRWYVQVLKEYLSEELLKLDPESSLDDLRAKLKLKGLPDPIPPLDSDDPINLEINGLLLDHEYRRQKKVQARLAHLIATRVFGCELSTIDTYCREGGRTEMTTVSDKWKIVRPKKS